MTDVQAPDSCTLRFDGNAGAIGFVRGQARVVLPADAPDRTRRQYVTSAQVGGKLAQIGSRLVDAAAGAAAKARRAHGGLGLWGLPWAFLRRLLGKR